MDPKMHGKLTEIYMRGFLAALFLRYGVTSLTTSDWDVLEGRKEITARDLGEIAGAMGYSIDLQLIDRTKGDGK